MSGHGRKASDVMTRNVITVDPATLIVEIANILESHHIKRIRGCEWFAFRHRQPGQSDPGAGQ